MHSWLTRRQTAKPPAQAHQPGTRVGTLYLHVLVIVVVLTLARIIDRVVTVQASVTLEWKHTPPGKKKRTN